MSDTVQTNIIQQFTRISSFPACLTNRMWCSTKRFHRKCLHERTRLFEVIVMIDLNSSHTCESKTDLAHISPLPAPCDITVSSHPVLADTTLVSRTVWALKLPGNCLFPDLKQKQSRGDEWNRKCDVRDKIQELQALFYALCFFFFL